MTYQELLHNVDFRKVADAYCMMYPGQAHMLPFLKCHYDMLCNTTPIFDPDANSQVCRVIMRCDEWDKEWYLSAFSMEGDLWSATLCKTLEVDPVVTASLEEIAACCLWHTSFYGYTEEQLAKTAEEFSEWRNKNDLEIYQQKLLRNLSTIEEDYSYISTLPSLKDIYKVVKSRANERYKIYRVRHVKKRIRNRWFRREFIRVEYYRYLYELSQFILDVKSPDESINGLCRFYRVKKFIVYNYRSYTYGKCDPAEYLCELIDEYKAFDKIYENVYICLVRPYENNLSLTETERRLCYSIKSSCKVEDCYVSIKYDLSLMSEMRMIVAFYE